MQRSTNATESKIASVLRDLGAEADGTLISALLRKKGVVRGKGDLKKAYGDDFIHALIWSGFEYPALCERARRRLAAMQAQGNLITKLTAACIEQGYTQVTVNDASEAVQEVMEWLNRVTTPRGDWPDDMPEDDEKAPVWEPLEIDGVKVRGAKVYIGPGRPHDKRAPKPGHIYLDGVKLGEVVLEPAANGAWEPKSKGKSVAKRVLRSWLPTGLYVRYCLAPETLLLLKVGEGASKAANEAGIRVDPEAIRALFKIAA